jgi:hypothetical protein
LKIGNISLGWDLVTGRNLVPHPAAAITAFLIFICYSRYPEDSGLLADVYS